MRLRAAVAEAAAQSLPLSELGSRSGADEARTEFDAVLDRVLEDGLMAGYDPKQKRAHSPAAEEHAPVDDLLGPPPAPVHDPDTAPETAGPEVAERPTPTPRPEPAHPVAPNPRRPLVPTPPPANGPDPKVLAIAAGGRGGRARSGAGADADRGDRCRDPSHGPKRCRVCKKCRYCVL